MLFIILGAIALLAAAVAAYLQLPVFGAAPEGERLARIQRSPNFKDGAVRNPDATTLGVSGNAWQSMMAKAQNPDNTLSAQVLADTERFDSSWQFGKSLAQMHANRLRHQGLVPEKMTYFEQLAKNSVREQADIEQNDTQDFYAYVGQFR